MNFSRASWYWHRLRAMDLAEIAGHLRKKLYQLTDARGERDWAAVKLEEGSRFPKLPVPAAAPAVLREALQRDVEDIMHGRWRAFGHLELEVDDPPHWQQDYLVGKNLRTTQSAFKLDHRELPGGTDIKLIWELSRWYQLLRLAQAAHVLEDALAARTCLRWLADWVAQNPPYRGWNWTSALESGMRLVQFAWIDALLAPQAAGCGLGGELARLRLEILPPHVWFTWRYKSFGSSANNHLLGELTGLILATVRWPPLAQWGAPIEELQRRWQHEVLAQFAEDGGNREQALNYQLFSWEFCWQARLALSTTDKEVASRVEERLARAARFFWEVQARREPWDYGDSDNGFVTPFFTAEQTALLEWRDWLSRAGDVSTLGYWLGEPPAFMPRLGVGEPSHTIGCKGWWIYRETSIAVCESGFWWLRWDVSPLGYLKTAAHGHLDALHLSLWFNGVAIIIDPGTGAYYANKKLRSWLASRAAHNGPCPVGDEYPKRLGTFLWAEHHARPEIVGKSADNAPDGLMSELSLPTGLLRRRITRVESGDGWQVQDEFEARPGVSNEFTVRWQFGPGTWIKRLEDRKFEIHRKSIGIIIEVSANWAEAALVENQSEQSKSATQDALEGVVSPAFRKTAWAPYLKLTARGGENPCIFRTTFLASQAS